MDRLEFRKLASALIPIAQRAGRAAMEHYNDDMQVERKDDDSPVTAADRAAERIILEGLAKVAPHIPVLAEEEASEGNIPELGKRFFLVDPLDGTKEFINRNGEFTVNIALIENSTPEMGIIYAPAISRLYLTLEPGRAVRASLNPESPDRCAEDLDFTTITTCEPGNDGLVVVASRSHMNSETEDFLKDYTIASQTCAGSSLKLCLLAEGKADIYPRLARTMEWDIGAGHAILNAAGGCIRTKDGRPLTYGKAERGYDNPGFIAWGTRGGIEAKL